MSRRKSTSCRECDEEVFADTDPKPYEYDLCPKHYKEDKEAKPIDLPPVMNEEVRRFIHTDMASALRQFGVPPRAANDAVKYWLKDGPEIDGLMRFLQGKDINASYYIYGRVGTGKTVLGAAMLYHYAYRFAKGDIPIGKGIFQANKFMYVSLSDLFYQIRSSYGQPGQGAKELIERVKKATMLVLDDVGNEKVSDWATTTLYLIVDHRYQYDRTTVFTSNFSLEELQHNVGDARIVSRINGWCEVTEINSKNRRIKGADDDQD